MRQYGWRRILVVAAMMLAGGLAAAQSANETVPVSGSDTRYPAAVEVAVAGQPTRLVLTGAALRKRLIISVYAVASYVQQNTGVRTAEQLVAAEAVKVLHLVMERDVDGKDMADAIRTGIRLNYPAGAFAAELSKVDKVLETQNLKKGQHVVLTALPKVGLRCQIGGATDIVIDNPAFARAIWEIYLGRNNLGEPLKAALVSRL